jgi:hypothetical protein
MLCTVVLPWQNLKLKLVKRRPGEPAVLPKMTEVGMKKWIPIGLLALGPCWFWLAWESAARGKNGIAAMQAAAGFAFMIRAVIEWRKANQF